MRIRSTVAGLALGVGVLFLAAPVALADTQPTTGSSPAATPAQPSDARPTVSTRPTAQPAPSTSVREKAPVATPAQVAEKPRGAAETGAGMQDSGSANTGMIVIGGVALVAVAGGGTVLARRLRKQG